MTTSGSIDFTLTARQVVTFALRKLGVTAGSETPAPEDSDQALEELNMMLKGMQKSGPMIFTVRTDGTKALTAATAAHVLTTEKPLRLLEVRYSDTNDREIPMTEMTRTEYWELPEKTSSGVPTNYWYDDNGQGFTIYVWPVKATVTTETIEFTYIRRIEDIDDLANTLDIPNEWLDTVGYNLAERLISTFGVKGERAARIEAKAAQLWQQAKDYDREDIVTMVPERRYG